MEIHVTQTEDYVLVVCQGQLDESTSRCFRDEVHPLFAERGAKVVVDLADSKWINSEGIAAMVRLITDANTRGCRVVFAAPNAFVGEVLQVTRLNKFFDVAPSRDEALAMLSAGDGPSGA